MNSANSGNLPPSLAGNYALQVIALALAFAAAALLGRVLSLPPAFASPIWPAAGVALAGLILGGKKLWPGILLGHFLFAVLGKIHPGDVLTIALASFPFAAGPVLQALCGAWFARRGSTGLVPGREITVFRTLLLAGPVACLIGASWAMTLMLIKGNVDLNNVFSNWLLWWVGDTLGVLLFAPLCMLLLPAGRRIWPGRTRQIALPLLGACAILLPSVYLFHTNERTEALEPVALQANLAYDLSRERMTAVATEITATANLFSASEKVSAREFQNFTHHMTANGLLNLGWTPRVPHEQREEFEAEMRRQGLKDFRLLQSAEDGSFEPASTREDYFPLLYSTAGSRTLRPAGFDYGSIPRQAPMLARARDSGKPVALLPAAAGVPARTAIFVLYPIYQQGLDPASMSIEQRRQAFSGFVGGAIDPLVAMSPLFSAAADGPVSFSLADATLSDAGRLLNETIVGQSSSSPMWTRSFDFFGRTLQVDSFVDDSYWQAGQSSKSRIFLLLALLGAFLISMQTLVAAVRDRTVSLRVAARTRELNHNRRRLRGALNVAKIACWDLDVSTGYLTLDDHAFAILKTTAKAEGGHNLPVSDWIREFVHPDDADEVREALRIAAIERPHPDMAPREFRVIARDGKTRHLQMYFDVDVNKDGIVTMVYGSSQDITARKNMEIALRESEAYSRSLLQSSSDCIMVLSLDGLLQDMNKLGIELLYLDDLESVRGTDWRQFWKLDADYEAASLAIEKARNGEPARFTGYTPSINAAPRWWDVAITPVLDTSGTPKNLLCVARDISVEHKAQDEIRRINASLGEEVQRRSSALSASERELRAIFEVAAIGIAHIGLDDRILRVNPKMREITGFDENEFLKQHDFERTHVEDRQREKKLVADLVSGEIETYVFEKRYLRKDDITIWVRVTGSLVRDEKEQPLYRVSIVEDISAARAEAELRTASERRYRELFDRNPTPMWTYDTETLAFTSVNEAAVQHYGYSREEFLGMTLRDIRPSDKQSELDELLRQRLPGYTPAHTTTHVKKDGTPVTAEITAHGIVNDGRPARLIVANDVTERVLASTLLEGQKNVLEQIAFGAPLANSLTSLAQVAEASAGSGFCTVMLVDSRTRRLKTIAAPSLDAEFSQAVDAAAEEDSGFFSTVATSADAAIVADIASDPRWESLADVARAHSLSACWSNPICDADGRVLGAFVIYYNNARTPHQLEGGVIETLTNTAAIAITKDRETRKLRESEEKFRATFETAALGMLHVDLSGRFTRANPTVCKIIGYSEEELLGMNPEVLAHPDDIEKGQLERARMFSGEIPSYAVEKRYIHKDGSTVWMNVTISTVKDKTGQVEYAVALLEDISWRKQAEAELHRQQEINRLLLENLTEGVVACDADGQLMLFNKAAREWHGADPREIPPEQWSDYYDLFDADGETPLDVDNIPLMRAFRGERVKAVEMSIARKGHPPRIVLASGAPLLDADGTKRGAVVVMHDVTLRRQSLQKLERSAEKLRAANAAVENERASLARRVAERTLELTAANTELALAKEAAEAASRAKSAFLAVMSHEIRTPMNGILGMVDVLSQSLLAEDQKDAVMTIRDSSFSLLRLIDDILDFSKVEAGRLELESTVISLPEIVEGVCDSLTPDALANDVDLKLFVDPKVPKRVLSDPTRLRQLLFNLIGNAIKFSGGRSTVRGCVQVQVERDSADSQMVAFHIIDNGVGIAPAAMPRLFDSFTQAEISTTRRFGGTGLGLAITKRLVELMHGTIDVTSTLGEGSTFIVRLPLQQSSDRVEKPEFDLGSVNCLLVDSHNSDTTALAAYLDDAKVATRIVADSDAAARLAAESGETTVVVRHIDAETPADDELFSLCERHRNQVNLLVTRGPRIHARILAPHIVVLQASAIRRRDFLRAVAVAAGRASPETSGKQILELVRGQLVAPTVAQARTDGRLILVAEDDAINQKVILRQLALLGYAGEMASNGEEALRLWREGSYALLLTDLHMPEMDGYALARNIRGEESTGSRMPIIALTANALRGEAERAAKAGFDAYLTKPLQLSVLSATLDEWIPEVRSEKQKTYMQAAGAASKSSPAIDKEVLRSIIGNDQAMMNEFLGEYLNATENQVAELLATVAEGDARRIAEKAHRQKGAARAIGAGRLGDLCAELENAARADDHALIQQIATQFEAAFAEVDAEIRRLLHGAGQRRDETSFDEPPYGSHKQSAP